MKNKRLKTKNKIEVVIDIIENLNLKKEPKTIPNAKNMTKWEDLASDNSNTGLSNIQWKLLDTSEDSNILRLKIEIIS